MTFLFISCNKDDDNPLSNNEIIHPGVYDISISVDTLDRWFKLIVPSGYTNQEKRPLLLAFHGGNLSMGFMYNNRKDLIKRCEEENWLLALPNGANADGNRGAATWNAIHCCDPAFKHNVDDIKFSIKIINTLEDNLLIDEKRIYAMGGSNGAMLVHRLASELPEYFAAVAESQGSVGGKLDTFDQIITVQPKVPVPILMIHGINDAKVKFSGGWSDELKRWDLSFESSVSLWAENNLCDITKADTTIVQGLNGKVYIIDIDDCGSNMPVKGIAIENKGHGWPGLEESGFDGTNASIDFLKQFSQ